MFYLVMCPYLRQTFDVDSPINKNDLVKCPFSCPKKSTCKNATALEFKVVAAQAYSAAKTGIKMHKENDCWVEGEGNSEVIKTTAASAKPVFSMPSSNTVANKPVFNGISQVNEETNKPVFNSPSPVDKQDNNRPVFNLGSNNNSEESNNSQTSDSPIFPSRSNVQFPTRENSQQNITNSNSMSDLRSRFSTFTSKGQSQSSSITRGVTTNDFKMINIGGVFYTEDFTLIRTRGGKPLPSALDEIFGHWNLDLVFENNHTLSKQFIWLLLKLHILPNPSKEETIANLLNDVIVENIQSDKSAKFFYLMMMLNKKRINRFYYPDEDKYSFAMLQPRFTNVDEYVFKFFSSDMSGESFRKMSQQHLCQVMYYLGYTDKWPNRDNKEAFLKEIHQKQNSLFADFVIRHYESTSNLVHVEQQGDNFAILNLGDYKSFIKAMQFPQDLETSRRMYSFLKLYRFTSDGSLLPRDISHPLLETDKPDFEGSLVYQALGLQDAAYYLEEYNLYCIFLKEYLETFEPNEISINGVIHLSKLNFVAEIKTILLQACQAAFTSDMPLREEYLEKALLTYSLLVRGVLSRYTSFNQAKEDYDKFMLLFDKIATNSITVKDYSTAFKKEALYYIDGATYTIREYMKKCAQNYSPSDLLKMIPNNDILLLFIQKDAKLEKNIDAQVKTYDKFFTELS